MNNKIKKTICIITSLFVSSFIPANKTLVKNKTASYSKGNVYIDSSLPSDITDNPFDVFVIDKRNNSNPNMKICDSYRICSVEDREAIIDILLKYEEDNKSEWNRTKESLLMEWYVHNLLYELGIERGRTRDVDFDNDDENKYSLILRR